MKGYKDLDVYNLAFELSIKIHEMSLKLPKYELYGQGSQIRRLSKSVKSYGRRKYKNDFIRFLVFSHASNDETIDHLQTLKLTHKIKNIDELLADYDKLGRKLYKFIDYVEQNWKSEK